MADCSAACQLWHNAPASCCTHACTWPCALYCPLPPPAAPHLPHQDVVLHLPHQLEDGLAQAAVQLAHLALLHAQQLQPSGQLSLQSLQHATTCSGQAPQAAQTSHRATPDLETYTVQH